MSEIVSGTNDLVEVADHLTRNLNPQRKNGLGKGQEVHLDPYLRCSTSNTLPDWRPAFGQDGAAQGHLLNQKASQGDIFLFFGWFRQIEWDDRLGQKRWRFKPKAPDLHVIFGWLQIGQILPIGPAPVHDKIPDWLKDHPHIQDAHRFLKHNTIYVASRLLRIGGKRLGLAGGGTFDSFTQPLRLTHPDARKHTDWQLPHWFLQKTETGKPTLTYHQRDWRWSEIGKDPSRVRLQTVARGQEFVLGINKDNQTDANNWLKELFATQKIQTQK